MIEALKLRLRQHLKTAEDLPGATVAFRVLYRLMEDRPGNPHYPEPVTWGLIEDYVGILEEREEEPVIYGPILARLDNGTITGRDEEPARQPGTGEEEDPAHV